MGKLIESDHGQAGQVETSRKKQSQLLAFLNENAVTVGKVQVNNLTAILLSAVFALHNPMPAIALVVLLSLRSMWWSMKTNSDLEQQG